MAANTVTYFGDVTTVGNTTLFQNLTSQGNYSIFSGNVNPAVSLTSNLVGFSAVYSSNLNVATLNTTSIFGTAGSVGVGTTTSGYSLDVFGNFFGSNAMTAPVVLATTSANIGTLNTASIFATSGPGRVGVNTLVPTANLHVVGNVFGSNALSAPVVNASTSANISTLNTESIFATSGPGRVGVNTLAPTANLHVAGNLFGSNALTAPVVNASTSANISTLNTASIFATSGPGRVGVGLLTPGSNLHVAGNVYASNAISTPVVLANVANIATLVVSQIWRAFGNTVGFGTSVQGANVQVAGNVWASNALQTPVVIVSTSANILALNTASIFATSGPNLVGVGLSTPGSNLHVAGNVFGANALTTPVVLANVANVATMNVSQIWRAFGNTVGFGTAVQGANVQIAGNLWASNALQTPVVIASTSANAPTLVTNSVFGSSGAVLGIGTSTGLGANLHVQGNVWVSNSMTGVLQFTNATFDQATYLAGTPRIFTPGSVLGIGTLPSATGAALQVGGNLWSSNALQAPNVFALNSANTPLINTASFAGGLGVRTVPGGWTLNVSGDLQISNGLTGVGLTPTVLNVSTINVTTISNLNPILTLSVSNSIQCPINGASLANLSVTLNTSFINSNVGFGTAYVSGGPTLALPTGATLFAANAVSADVRGLVTANISQVLNTSFINSNVGFGTAYVAGGPTLTMASGANLFAANAITADVRGLVQANISSVLNTSFINSNVGFGTAYIAGGPTLTLPSGANLFAANAITADIRGLVQANISSVLNTSFINSNVGFGTAYIAGGPTLTLPSGANLFASNSISSSFVNLVQANAVTLNLTSLGFTGGVFQPITGNIYASNSVQTGNVLASGTMNIAGMANILSFSGRNVGIGTSTNLGANLQVQGNIWVSNLTGTYLAIDNTTANFATINTTTIWTQANPAVIQSSVLVSGDVPLTNSTLSAEVYAGSLRYTLDISNVFVRNFQLSALRTATCVYSNVVNGPQAGPDYRGSAYMNDGRVVFAPWSASNIGVYSPALSTFSAVSPAGFPNESAKFSGAVAVPSGNVVFVPSGASNVGMWNPQSRLWSNVSTGASGFEGGILAPTGRVVCVPGPLSANLGVFDPVTLGFTNVAAIPGYSGAVLAPNGNVIFVPNTAPNVGIFDPVTLGWSLGPPATPGGFTGGVLAAPSGNVIFVPGTSQNVGVLSADLATLTQVPGSAGFSGGVLLPTGNVMFVPLTASNVGLFDPVALTFSNVAECPGGFSGGSLLPDGRVVMCPWTSANVGVVQTLAPAPSKDFCLAPYFNHC